MKKTIQYTTFLILLTCLLMMSPGVAYAYLDPGTGSMILQGILGGLAAIAVAGKIYWKRLKDFFGFKGEETKRICKSKTEVKNTEDDQ